MTNELLDLWRIVHEQLPPRPHTALFGRTEAERRSLVDLGTHLDVQPLLIDELTSILRLERGRVFAVRWDLSTDGIGFKQPVVASLLLFHLWNRPSPPLSVTTLIDAGNVNSCLALVSLGRRFGVSVEYVLSRHFPAYIHEFLRGRGGNSLRLMTAPASACGKEREFYGYLFNLMYEERRRRTHLCLWHARYGGIAVRWLGEAFAADWEVEPDDIVIGLGAGSTLEGFALPLKERFGRRPRVVAAEHEATALLRAVPTLSRVDSSLRIATRSEYRDPPKSIPHAVLGPHYDEVNPLISPTVLSEIGATVRYTDRAWQDTSRVCRAEGVAVGNSSAANLAVARVLANQGRTVFTYIYEDLRPYYLREEPAEAAQSLDVLRDRKRPQSKLTPRYQLA